MKSKQIGVGILGFGTVGQASARLLREHAAEIRRRSGAEVRVRMVCRRTRLGAGEIPAGAQATADWRKLVNSPEVDLVVECMGGTSTAREAVMAALELGKPVVTANKNLLAEHGEALLKLALAQHLPLGFEASVAGGVPVVRAIAEGTAADRLRAIRGILNGTANYILTVMEQRGSELAPALEEAQRRGYAEADPTMDISGRDARDKLAILARLGFGLALPAAKIPAHGIERIAAVDMLYARQLGGRIRLLATAELRIGTLEASVRPWLLKQESLLAKVEGVNNAVVLEGEHIGTQMFYGPGAGGGATGVAVVSDVMEIAGMMATGTLGGRRVSGFTEVHNGNWSGIAGAAPWYLRLTIRDDRPGILARIAEIIAHEGINIDSVVQAPQMAKEKLSFVVTVEPVAEATALKAVKAIDACEFMVAPVQMLRME